MSELMSRSDEVAYVPFMFGYSNYARPNFAPHVVRFKDIPSVRTRTSWKRVGRHWAGRLRLLGTPTDSHRLCPFRGDSGVPKGSLLRVGDSPGTGAWTDPKVNQLSSDFFKDTLRTLDLAYLRSPHRVPRISRTGGGDHQ